MYNKIKYIDTPYAMLVEIFGKPSDGDSCKTLAEWQLSTPFGWAEIYDYNSDVDKPEDVQEWHVQAEKDSGFTWVFERLGIDG
jgi:hypothetical protein